MPSWKADKLLSKHRTFKYWCSSQISRHSWTIIFKLFTPSLISIKMSTKISIHSLLITDILPYNLKLPTWFCKTLTLLILIQALIKLLSRKYSAQYRRRFLMMRLPRLRRLMSRHIMAFSEDHLNNFWIRSLLLYLNCSLTKKPRD
jgi:hypothetical protein